MTGWGRDWQPECRLCETVPSLGNGLAVREALPDGGTGLRLTFRLRQGLAWADGAPVAPADFVFTWQASRDAATGFLAGEFWRRILEVRAEDARSLSVLLDGVTFDFVQAASFAPLRAAIEQPRWAADPATYRNRSAYETEPTLPGLWLGPYRVAAVQPGSAITLDRNAHWPGPAPALRRIVIRAVENTTALEAQLLAGQLDMVGVLGLPTDQAAALETRVGPRFRFRQVGGLGIEQIEFNLDNPALADSAIEELLRYESPSQHTGRICRAPMVLGGQTISAGAPVLAVMAAANRDPSRFTDPDRLDLARADRDRAPSCDLAHRLYRNLRLPNEPQ